MSYFTSAHGFPNSDLVMGSGVVESEIKTLRTSFTPSILTSMGLVTAPDLAPNPRFPLRIHAGHTQ
jgi:hypothetical protein